MSDRDETAEAADALSRLGAQVQFFVQRIMYLHQHPDARPAQEFLFNDDAAYTDSLVSGACDVIPTNRGQAIGS